MAGVPVSLEGSSPLHAATNIHHISTTIHSRLHLFSILLPRGVQGMNSEG